MGFLSDQGSWTLLETWVDFEQWISLSELGLGFQASAKTQILFQAPFSLPSSFRFVWELPKECEWSELFAIKTISSLVS